MSSRRLSAALLAVAILAAVGAARAQTTDWRTPLAAPELARTAKDTTLPRWVSEPLSPVNSSRIVRMLEGKADVVALDSGYYQGFRDGVVCLVQRSGTAVARLIVVSAEANRSAALILDVPQTVILVPGDEVRLSAIFPTT